MNVTLSLFADALHPEALPLFIVQTEAEGLVILIQLQLTESVLFIEKVKSLVVFLTTLLGETEAPQAVTAASAFLKNNP